MKTFWVLLSLCLFAAPFPDPEKAAFPQHQPTGPACSPDTLPIPGRLSQAQIDRYYPGVLDTIKDIRTVGAEPVDLTPAGGHLVSMLHNAGNFDQMILCTHDTQLVLIDHLYIGKATDFDRTSHTITYQKAGPDRLAFHHVDWGFVKKNGASEIDTVHYRTYVLSVTASGHIIRL
ncbi:MAG: hypothetical protein D6722_02645 [Bacteroidetes bacterium]|nr:MAG: hypothetical protein D6722_02645 [Bacteroidota bacterium]